MNIIKLQVDAAGASVELFDGWTSVYKFRVGAAVEAVRLSGAFAAYKFVPAENRSPVILWAPCRVAEDVPAKVNPPGCLPIPPAFKSLDLEGCRGEDWFIKLMLQIRRMYPLT